MDTLGQARPPSGPSGGPLRDVDPLVTSHFVAADRQRLGAAGRVPAGTLHGVEPGAGETLCGTSAGHLAWFERIDLADATGTRCRSCVKALRRKHRDQLRDVA